jgi:hypothetical protein
MRLLKPSFSAVLTLAWVLGLGTESWLLLQERALARRARAGLAQKLAERDWLVKQMPALTSENEQAIAAELVQAEKAAVALRASLRGPEAGWLDVHPPAKPLDAFFDIASFVERARSAAAQAQIGCAPGERFGFAAYVREGPAPEFLPAVYRQRLIAERLVDMLIAARPLALLGLRRESLEAVQSADKNGAGDFFTLEPAFSLRQPGQLDTMAFRLEFSGRTAVLRNFLNSLAAFPQPFVVRSVEAEPLPAADHLGFAPAGEQDLGVPLVRSNLTKFAVTVEFVLPNATRAQSNP